MGIAATESGHGLEFCREVSALLWDGSVTGWDQGSHLSEATARSALVLSALEKMVNADPERYEGRLDENDRALHSVGYWGVPTMVFEGEPFFGQDRFDMLVWRM